MLPETHPLIEAATKPLADNAEQRLAAHALLGETFDPAHPGGADAMSRLERVDRMKRPWLPMAAICGLAAVSLVAFLFIATSMNRSIGILRALTASDSAMDESALTRFSPEERLLLGDPALTRLEQKEALHLSDPGRPDFYAEYAGAYFQEHFALPSDYLDTVGRLDPDNAFFLYNAAGKEGGDSVSKTNSSSAPGVEATRMRDGVELPPVPGETAWKADDPAAFGKALEMIGTATGLPRYDTYETALSEARTRLFDQSCLPGRLHALAYQAAQTTQTISIRKVVDLLCASAYLSSVEGDEERFLRTRDISEAFLRHLSSAPQAYLVVELIYAASADLITRSLYHGAVRLGRDDLAASLGERKAAFQELRDLRNIRKNGAGGTELAIKREGSVIQSRTLPMVAQMVANPPSVDGGDLRPGRLADHDFVSALAMSFIVSALFIVALFVLLFRLRAPRHVKILAGRFAQLLDARDWAWILGAGVALPFALVFSISWLTPFGGRGLGIETTRFLFPVLHFNILLMLLLSVPPVVVRWRLAGRLAPFGLDVRAGWFAISICVLGVMASLLPFPIMGWEALPSSAMVVVAGTILLWQGAILVGILRALLGKRESRLPKAIVGHALFPVFLATMVLSVATVPLILGSANHRISEDLLTKVVPTGLSRFEAGVAAEIRREVNAILGFE